MTNITQHMAGEGWVFRAAVIDVSSHRCVGWSIANHIRTELVDRHADVSMQFAAMQSPDRF